jgi:hypothetical protein
MATWKPDPLWWPFAICLLGLTVANLILILVSAPVWARLIPAWLYCLFFIVAMSVLLRRRALRKRDSSS